MRLNPSADNLWTTKRSNKRSTYETILFQSGFGVGRHIHLTYRRYGRISARNAEENRLARGLRIHARGAGIHLSFPWVFLPKIQYQWVVVPPKNPPFTPNMPLNQWWHARNIITSDYRDGGAPNNDTLYSATWLDVGKEPIILSHGDMGDRYFTFEIASMNSDNFAYVGASSTGSKAGHFAITGRDWEGNAARRRDAVAPVAYRLRPHLRPYCGQGLGRCDRGPQGPGYV